MKEELYISVVSPVYMAENIVEELVSRVSKEVAKLSSTFEIVLVEDFSPDNSWEKIEELCKKYPFVKGVKLSRNFGQHNAIRAGVSEAKGDVVVLMDCDLQDDPGHIKLLVEQFQNGNDIVYTKRIKRKHSFFKYITAKIYNSLFNILADKNFDLNVGSLVLFSKKVRNEFLKLTEHESLYIQSLKWLGFKHVFIPVEHRERFEGESSYKLKDLIRLAIQGWVSNSEKLLYISIKLGFLFTIISIAVILYVIYKSFTVGYDAGWPSLISVILLSTGMILISLGVLGIYIGKIFNEVKNRPLFIIDKTINL